MNCNNEKKSKACFLDRDGVLIEEVNYLSKPEQVSFFPETVKALQLLKDNNYKIIVVTNQGGVARGYFSEDSISKVHSEINSRLKAFNLQIDHFYYCPHHPEGSVKKYAVNCSCRKPMPGMILQAVKDFNLDLDHSFLIGDKISDLLAAEKSGCPGILVETGHGKEHIKEAVARGFPVLPDIEKAVQYFLDN